MTLKTFGAMAAAAAIGLGLCLWTMHGQAEPKSQIDQIELGRG